MSGARETHYTSQFREPAKWPECTNPTDATPIEGGEISVLASHYEILSVFASQFNNLTIAGDYDEWGVRALVRWAGHFGQLEMEKEGILVSR
jgi:hypothetical protein